MARINVSAAQKVEQIAEDLNADFREAYSGRGMYVKECVGIVTDYPNEVIAAAGRRGIRGAVTDSMGRSTIVYWPAIASVVSNA